MNGPRPFPRQSPLAAILQVAAISLRVFTWAVIAWLLGSLLLGRFNKEEVPPAPAPPMVQPQSYHIARFLISHGAPKARASQVAQVLVDQAKRHQADAALVAAVMTVENPELVRGAQSDSGAMGLMQVMPHWTGDRGARQTCRSTDLLNDRVNICYGIYVLKLNLAERKTLVGALLAYNGCRSAENPCGRYPIRVLQRQRILQLSMGG